MAKFLKTMMDIESTFCNIGINIRHSIQLFFLHFYLSEVANYF